MEGAVASRSSTRTTASSGVISLFPDGAAELAHHLLVILHVQGIRRFERGQLLVKIASPCQVAGLHAGMSQQFHDFTDVGGFSGFVKQVQQFLQGVGIIAHVPDDGVQAVEHFVRVFRQQTLGVLIENLESILVLPGLHQRVGEAGDRRQIVVHGQQLAGNGSGFGELSGLQVSLEQIAETIGIGIDVGNFLQRGNRPAASPDSIMFLPCISKA